MRKRSILSAAAVLALSACATSYDVYDIGSVKKEQLPDRNLVYYALPQTIAHVEIPVTLKSAKAPQCTDQTLLDQLHITADDIEAPGKTFKLGDVTISTRTEPDPSAVFAIDMPSHALHKYTRSVELAESGILTSAQSTDENQAVNFGVGVVKIAAGVAGKVIGAGAGNDLTQKHLTPCQEIANEIITLKGNRDQLISGTGGGVNAPTKDALQLMLDQLDARIDSLLANFTGAVEKTTYTISCEAVPLTTTPTFTLAQFASDGSVVSAPLCTFPAKVAANGSNAAATVTLAVQSKNGVASAVTTSGRLPNRTAGNALYYRLPVTATLQVSRDGKVLAKQDTAIAQLGAINSLPRGSDAHALQSVVNATLYPGTGGLQKLEFNATQADTSAI